jgi:hypothetical protein
MESGFTSERIFTDCIQLGMFAVRPGNQNEESASSLGPF